MPGTPSRTLELEIAPLLAAQLAGVPGNDVAQALAQLITPQRAASLKGHTIVPLGLRWRVSPAMGLPRAPFSVFRRARKDQDPLDVSIATNQVGALHLGRGRYRVPSTPLYVLYVGVRNTHATDSVSVAALDPALRSLPQQSVQVPANSLRIVRFQHPFIAGFSIRGGTPVVTQLQGVTMQTWIAQPEWELLEIAGLPALAGEVAGYDPQQQGEAARLEPPPDAASRRVAIAQHFYRDLATSLPSGMSVPQWQIPTRDEALQELRGASPSLLARIGDMLKATDQGDVPTQAAFRALVSMPGLHQPETPGQATEDAVMELPLLATVLLNATTDPWFALASGFGTTDFTGPARPSGRFIEPASYFNVTHDYMVASTFIFRHFGFTSKREHCALSHRSAFLPVKPGGLATEAFALNRPPRRDDPWSQEISVTWARVPRLIHGAAIAAARENLQGTYLNPARTGADGKRALLVPAKPGETSDPVLATRNRFFHHGAEIPFAGTRTFKYGVASMDAFARWSEWSVASQALSARLPESPRLVALSLVPDMARVAGNAVPHTLTFEVIWDWQDRSPKRLQVAGVFHARHTPPGGTPDEGHVPPADYPGLFQRDNAVAGGALLELAFPSDTPPGTPPVFTAVPAAGAASVTVELLAQATNGNGQNVDGEMRRYRVSVRDFNVSFAPEDEWFFSLFVKAAEFRNPVLLSDSTPPLLPGRPPRLTASVPNPIPPPPPVFTPATVTWAALPDARETSRFRLAFERVPTAMGGYAIYQAYEAKLRELAQLPAISGVDLVARATELRDVVAPLARAMDAFSRLNAKPVPQPAPGAPVEFEAELPGALDGLVAFAVKSVTREQEASPLSTPWIVVAVPKRVIPGAPALSLAGTNDAANTLACELAKTPASGRVEIVRARNAFAARDFGTMGPPIHESLPAAWQPVDGAGRPVTSVDAGVRLRFTFEDAAAAPSWFPYLYRALAVGASNDATGVVGARSASSNLISVEKLPRTLPRIEGAEGTQSSAQRASLRFRSDALLEPTPRGRFTLEVHAFDFAQGAFGAAPSLAVALPRAQPRPGGGLAPGILYAGAADGAGVRTFEAVFDVPRGPFMLRVRLADPLGRVSERIVNGKVEHVDPPNLTDLRLKRSTKDLLVRFASTTPPRRPPNGEYRVVIGFVRQGLHVQPARLIVTPLHEIREGNLDNLPASPTTTILRSSSTPGQYGALIKNFFATGPLAVTPHGLLRVAMTAPDGTAANVEKEL